MRVICDCEKEMVPVVDQNGNPELWYPVVTLHFMGLAAFEGRGFYFECPACKKVVTVIQR